MGKKARNPTTNAQGRVGPPPRQVGEVQKALSYTSLKIFDFWDRDDERSETKFAEKMVVGFLAFFAPRQNIVNSS
ncbi:hypothetical protein [Asticcacaulis benevestitus]|uniref:Uncharacterized protein n=1 Tax=Asticcacaulis benevestitus DSM 16100 = ATCC BAA-896 TaxID=1121022 RepID=V4RK24_9CAUL|nr:hypothetical protein [Asticcacaulis benevestitus]ESQ91643.1 hypothetical protein ABENE_09920 [Asticcacaulis benevestitus DSM 16100 = ATCC BAA-896]